MQLEWIDTLGLLKARRDANFLREFPLKVRRVITSEFVRYFSSNYVDACEFLKTPSHVTFSMELIGISFQLPMEDHDIINLALDIYYKWLFNKVRPAPIDENPQVYYRVCLFFFPSS